MPLTWAAAALCAELDAKSEPSSIELHDGAPVLALVLAVSFERREIAVLDVVRIVTHKDPNNEPSATTRINVHRTLRQGVAASMHATGLAARVAPLAEQCLALGLARTLHVFLSHHVTTLVMQCTISVFARSC